MEAVRLAPSDPLRSRALAEAALSRAAAADPRSASWAERALGLAARELHDIAGSEAHFRRAIRWAERGNDQRAAGQARMALVGTLAMRGDWAGALRQADQAEQLLHGTDLAGLHVTRSLLLMYQGRLEEALAGYQRAYPVLRRGGDPMALARLLNNRGLLHQHRGALALASADMRRADELYQSQGQQRLSAQVRQNLGVVEALRGDIPSALRWFDDAQALVPAGTPLDVMGLSDRCQALLSARLLDEARTSAEAAVAALAVEGRRGYLAIARLRLAEAALVGGDLELARSQADQAGRAFARQGRPAWAALARHVSLQAAWRSGDRSPALLAAARRTAGALATAGFTVAALDARLLAGQLALQLGRLEVARRELDLARQARGGGPVQLRSRAWHAEALLRLASGNRRGAEAALLAGVRLLERYRAALGATELRAHASGHVADVARLGMSLAAADGNARRTLDWIERWRAGSLRLRPVRPPDDTRLAAALGELRSVVTAFDAAVLAGAPTARLRGRQSQLEETVRDRARDASGVLAASLVRPCTAKALEEAVGDHALVEIFDLEGLLHAVVVTAGRARLHRLAPVAEVTSELEGLRFSLRRMAGRHGSHPSLLAAADAATYGARRLDSLLLEPLWSYLADRPLVIVPTGALHAVPWALLPSCLGRPVSVAPSASLWHRAVCTPTPPGDIVLVAGPGLPHAAEEVATLARRYPSARRLTGRDATCKGVCQALDGAGLAHIAAHGCYRADNPLFSSLQLADGPLTVYDLEALGRAPAVLILSACDSGLSDVQPGDELMGLAAAVFALGTRTLVASVFPVPDDATRPLMEAVHRDLGAGLEPAVALARAQAGAMGVGPAETAAAAAFVCFGTGSTPATS